MPMLFIEVLKSFHEMSKLLKLRYKLLKAPLLLKKAADIFLIISSHSPFHFKRRHPIYRISLANSMHSSSCTKDLFILISSEGGIRCSFQIFLCQSYQDVFCIFHLPQNAHASPLSIFVAVHSCWDRLLEAQAISDLLKCKYLRKNANNSIDESLFIPGTQTPEHHHFIS